MERRQHPRYAADFPVRVTDLSSPSSSDVGLDDGSGDHSNEPIIAGRLVDISQAGVCLLLPLEVPGHGILKLNIGESVFYGYVAYCTAEGPQFRVGVAIEQVLLGGGDLGGLLQQVLLEQMPATPGVLAADAYIG